MSASASYYNCASVDGIWMCSEKTLDMSLLAYYGYSKILKARTVFYWGTHTRFTVSVGIDPSLTKTRRTRSADCICMDKRARISPLWEILYYSRVTYPNFSYLNTSVNCGAAPPFSIATKAYASIYSAL